MLQQGGKPIQWQRRGETLPTSSLYHVGQGLVSASPWGLSDLSHNLPYLRSGFQGDSQVNGKGWKGWEAHCEWCQSEDISRVLEKTGKALATQTRRIQNWRDPVSSARGPNFVRAHACAGPCARVEAQHPCQMSSLMALHVCYWSKAPWWNQSSPVPAKPPRRLAIGTPVSTSHALRSQDPTIAA